MPELTSMRKLRWEKRKKEIKDFALQKTKQMSNFVRENRETIAVAIPVVTVGLKHGVSLAKSINHKSAVKRDIYDRKTRFYDHSLGCYWHTKRELRPDELLSVQRRKAAGESYGDIFKSMKLLK